MVIQVINVASTVAFMVFTLAVMVASGSTIRKILCDFEKKSYELESIRVAEASSDVYAHLDRSFLHDLLDVPLPNSIIVDYLHVSLLRHTRAIIQQIYAKLSASERIKLDLGLRGQKFPSFF